MKAGTRRGDRRESMRFRQSRRSQRFHSNSYSYSEDRGGPKEVSVSTPVSQSPRASWSAGESRQAPFDSQAETTPRVQIKPSLLPPKTSDSVEATSEPAER